MWLHNGIWQYLFSKLTSPNQFSISWTSTAGGTLTLGLLGPILTQPLYWIPFKISYQMIFLKLPKNWRKWIQDLKSSVVPKWRPVANPFKLFFLVSRFLLLSLHVYYMKKITDSKMRKKSFIGSTPGFKWLERRRLGWVQSFVITYFWPINKQTKELMNLTFGKLQESLESIVQNFRLLKTA